MGLVMDEDDYKVRYGAKFPNTTRPAIYNKWISNKSTNLVRAKAEAVHTAKIVDYQLFAAAKRETDNLIPAVIEDTWVCELCDPVTLYTSVSPSGLLAHLQVLCGGLHSLNVLALKNYIQNYHQDMEGITNYINALEDVQKVSKRVGNPITEDTLLLIATNAMLSMECFLRTKEIWEDLPMKENKFRPVKRCTKQQTGRPRSRSKPCESKTNFAPLTAHLGRSQKPDQENQANVQNRSVTDLNKYLDALAAAATMENLFL